MCIYILEFTFTNTYTQIQIHLRIHLHLRDVSVDTISFKSEIGILWFPGSIWVHAAPKAKYCYCGSVRAFPASKTLKLVASCLTQTERTMVVDATGNDHAGPQKIQNWRPFASGPQIEDPATVLQTPQYMNLNLEFGLAAGQVTDSRVVFRSAQVFISF